MSLGLSGVLRQKISYGGTRDRERRHRIRSAPPRACTARDSRGAYRGPSQRHREDYSFSNANSSAKRPPVFTKSRESTRRRDRVKTADTGWIRYRRSESDWKRGGWGTVDNPVRIVVRKDGIGPMLVLRPGPAPESPEHAILSAIPRRAHRSRGGVFAGGSFVETVRKRFRYDNGSRHPVRPRHARRAGGSRRQSSTGPAETGSRVFVRCVLLCSSP